MKTKIEINGNAQACLSFVPESEDEARKLVELVQFVTRHSYVFPREYSYMEPKVEFLIQSGSVD